MSSTQQRLTPADLGVDDVVDSHHHIWRMADLPWLQGPMMPRIFGPYEPVRRDYLVDEYVRDATAADVCAAVYVQPNWALDRVVDEIRWVQSVHEESGWPHAVVGSADLFYPGAGEVMERQKGLSPLLRGTRLQLHWHENPSFRYASGPATMHDPVFRANIGLLAGLGWLFELQVFPGQMADAARLVADFPETTFVLVHAGMLESADPRHVAPWHAGLELLAPLPNLVAKLSGIGTFVHRVDEELIRLVATTSVELFGSERCMFGSNFPIESIWSDFHTLVQAWLRVLADLPLEVRRDVLGCTARRVYSLPEPEGSGTSSALPRSVRRDAHRGRRRDADARGMCIDPHGSAT
jgi:predicted TIM-barrel fold metal-dependent hydrolase